MYNFIVPQSVFSSWHHDQCWYYTMFEAWLGSWCEKEHSYYFAIKLLIPLKSAHSLSYCDCQCYFQPHEDFSLKKVFSVWGCVVCANDDWTWDVGTSTPSKNAQLYSYHDDSLGFGPAQTKKNQLTDWKLDGAQCYFKAQN